MQDVDFDYMIDEDSPMVAMLTVYYLDKETNQEVLDPYHVKVPDGATRSLQAMPVDGYEPDKGNPKEIKIEGDSVAKLFYNKVVAAPKKQNKKQSTK